VDLAERARGDFWDPSRELKYWLRVAQKYRNEAKDLVARGLLEDAFVAFARAATIVLDRLPTHRDYNQLLTSQQRANLALVSSLSLPLCSLYFLHDLCVYRHGCRSN
jgi:STAM-binding protein